jgi:hypothetical protein
MTSDIKRKYFSPTLTTVKVDQEISLVMMTTPPPDPPGAPPVPKGSEALPQDNPFGGEKPDYSKM